MAVTNMKTVYPFSECFVVTGEDTDAIDVYDIPAKTVITGVLVIVETAGVGTSNLTVGDDDTADGYITAADATAAAGTVYGDVPTERGSYLYDSTVKAGYVKYYPDAGKEIKFDLSGSQTTDGVYKIIVTGYRFD